MYERTGMGWAEISWLEGGGLACNVRETGKPREVCFLSNPEDEAIARDSNCTQQILGESFWDFDFWQDPRPAVCDEGTGEGTVWCCPSGYPPEHTRVLPSQEPAAPAPQEPAAPAPQEPATPAPQEPVVSVPQQPAAPVPQSFWTTLAQPEAIATMGITVVVGGGILFYFLKRSRERRRYV